MSYSNRDFSATGAAAVTPFDTTVLEPLPVALWVGGAGNVAVTMFDGSEVTFTGVPAGTPVPIQVTKVKATGTTATTILALYN